MNELGENKKTLLDQIRLKQQEVDGGSMSKDAFVDLLRKLLNNYADLKVDDYNGCIGNDVYKALMESLRDPEETRLWGDILSMSENNEAEIQNKLRSVLDYVARYPNGPKILDANVLKDGLNRKQDEMREALEWNALDKHDYNAMRNYKQKYSNTVHKVELDDGMWQLTDGVSTEQLQRYLDDWQNGAGRHVDEAQNMLKAMEVWNNGIGEEWDDIFKIKKFIDENPNFPFISEVKEKYDLKRRSVLSDLRIHPEKCGKSDLDRYIKEGILTREALEMEGVLPPPRNVDPEQLPNLEQFSANPNYEAKSGSTDVYLFGVPGTGKTCLLMGLTGAAGNGYTINFREKGGPYAAALQQYVEAGVTPESTPGKYVTTIKCNIEEERKEKKTVILNHHVNFVEMSGEEFAHKIANNENDSISFSDMGDGTNQLLRNSNRKVFFIVIDPTVDNIKFTFKKYEKDENGNVIGIRPVTEYINQLACINKFVALFEADENREFMKKVDAIHFIVTKADTFGESEESRKKEASDLMHKKYANPIRDLIGYCRRTKRVNFASDYSPMVYPFSLAVPSLIIIPARWESSMSFVTIPQPRKKRPFLTNLDPFSLNN